jgi:predicted ester cyclase
MHLPTSGEMDRRIVDQLEANKQLVRIHFQALNDQDYQLLDKIHDPHGRNHAQGAFDLSEWPQEGVPFGPREVQETFEWLRSGFSNLRVDILDLLAEGAKVMARVEMTGDHDGEFVGLEPTGRVWQYQHVHIFRIEDGLIVEHWAVREDLKAMIQLGVIARPGPPN